MSYDISIVYCDNSSAINISKNPVQHYRTKHIDIYHHFIREVVEGKMIALEYVQTQDQPVDLLKKPLNAPRFESFRKSLGICVLEWVSIELSSKRINDSSCASMIHHALGLSLYCIYFSMLFCFYFIMCFSIWKYKKKLKFEKPKTKEIQKSKIIFYVSFDIHF